MANQGKLFSGEVTLYFHQGGTVYYCRFKDRSGKTPYIKKSLRTKDYAEAVTRAKEAYLKHLALIDAGFDPRELNWDQAVKLCVSKMEQGQPKDYLIRVNNTYFSKFFSTRFESLRNISSDDVMDYFRWRVDYWTRTPKPKATMNCVPVASPETMAKERRFIGLIFKTLFNARKINRMPEMPSRERLVSLAKSKGRHDAVSQNRRPAFSPNDYSKIQHHLSQKLKQMEGWQKSVQKLSIKRMILWCEFIARTGIRPQELKLIKFGDVEHIAIEPNPTKDGELPNYKGFIMSRVHIRASIAKTGRSRFASDIKLGGLKSMLDEWRQLNEDILGYRLKDEDFIFPKKRVRTDSDEKWKQPFSMVFAVQRMLQRIGLWEVLDHNGNTVRRTSYSLRAMFIEQRIREKVPTRFIAETCGTSQEMIDRYYDGSDGRNFFEHCWKKEANKLEDLN